MQIKRAAVQISHVHKKLFASERAQPVPVSVLYNFLEDLDRMVCNVTVSFYSLFVCHSYKIYCIIQHAEPSSRTYLFAVLSYKPLGWRNTTSKSGQLGYFVKSLACMCVRPCIIIKLWIKITE